MLRPYHQCRKIVMPTYNYYCNNCESYYSYFQRMSEASKKECEDCRGKIERIITGGSGLIFKGSGFYLTDYKKKNNKGNKKQDNKLKKNDGVPKSSKTNQIKSKKANEK